MSLLKRLGSVPEDTTASLQPPAPPATGRLSTGDLPGTGQVRPPAGELNTVRRPTLGTQTLTTPRSDSFNELKIRVQNRLISELDPRMDLANHEEVRRTVEETFSSVLEAENIVLTRVERMRLFEAISAEILGFGPIEPLLKDDAISEIMVNGPRQVYVERGGKLVLSDVNFQDDDHVMRVIDRIVSPLGRRIDESSPMVDARLPDGSRINAVIPPISLVGPTLTIRKFARDPLTSDDLVRFGTVSQEMVTFLKACVEARLNIVVSGGTGSGKTTTLNVLSSFIPDDERIITIENAAELQLRQDHVVTLESRPANIEGRGEVTIRDLVVNSLRMCLMAGVELPVRAIREQIAAAVDVIIQQARLKDGSRKVVAVTEVQGMEGDVIVLQDIFVFEQTGIENGKIVGRMRPTGIRPKFVEKFEVANIFLPPNIFGAGYDRFF
jgi:pilus assembly protein CpaF